MHEDGFLTERNKEELNLHFISKIIILGFDLLIDWDEIFHLKDFLYFQKGVFTFKATEKEF